MRFGRVSVNRWRAPSQRDIRNGRIFQRARRLFRGKTNYTYTATVMLIERVSNSLPLAAAPLFEYARATRTGPRKTRY